MINLSKPIKELQNGHKDKKRLADLHNLPCSVCKKFGLKQTTKTIAHHLIGLGIGKKASDKLTISLCDFHHFWGNKGEAVHSGIKSFEANFCTQDELLEFTNKMLGEL